MKMQKKSVSTIPLSMRGKKRYVLFTLHVDGLSFIPKDTFTRALHKHFLHCFGVLGLPAHRIKVIVFDSKQGKGIVRCAHTSKDAVIAALTLFHEWEGKKAILRTHQTSGTLKTLRPGFYVGE